MTGSSAVELLYSGTTVPPLEELDDEDELELDELLDDEELELDELDDEDELEEPVFTVMPYKQ
jgi:hypothetical protein